MFTHTNTYYSSNSSLSLSTSVMLGDTPVPAKPELTGVTNQPEDSKGGKQPSGTTSGGIHQDSSYGTGKTLATIGNGTIIVGGEETEPEGLNRDVDAVDKELYSIERTKGDLDLTIPNHALETIVDSVDSAVNKIAGFMSRLGTPLDVDLQEKGGQSVKQAFVGLTEMKGVSAEDANTFLQENPAVTEAIMVLELARAVMADNPEAFNQIPLEAQIAQVSAEIGQSVNNQLVDTLGMGEKYDVRGTEKPLTPAQSVTVALGEVQRYLDNLMQQDPKKAEMALVAIDAAMGGPVKAAISYVANKGLEAVAGEQLAHVEDRASSYIGYLIAGNYNTVKDFDDDVAAYDGSTGLMKDGGLFVLNNILGIGTGKKSGSDSTTVNSSNSGGSAQGNNQVSNNKDVDTGSSGSNTQNQIESKPANVKMADDRYLKRNGIDAHDLKSDFVGKKNISKYDIYVNKDTGELWIFRKGAKGDGIKTGEFIK